MNHQWKIILLSIFVTSLIACSEQTSSEKTVTEKEHFLSEKLETIKKAEAVEKMIQDAAAQQRRTIEDQSD